MIDVGLYGKQSVTLGTFRNLEKHALKCCCRTSRSDTVGEYSRLMIKYSRSKELPVHRKQDEDRPSITVRHYAPSLHTDHLSRHEVDQKHLFMG